ncbi:hypothetical protein OHW01_10100 [Acinetobacter baumannii]|nr:hypothetical protein [Acinetobacter baumannii]MDC4925087.1 hypothetical protein [Acinetobacter baumannii]MDC4940049.1 hypothetical protein [Acinetobacter baumannii]MDC4943592.1 hypothetical protein [Acinetobacter baumannii]MDC5301729.1 hypothetical protein [Acinetobacter baumannii]
MITKEFITLITVLLGFSTVIMGLMTYIITQKKKSIYDEEKSKIELDFLRVKLERELYDLNNRLSKTDEQFKEMNYFPIKGNSYINENQNIILNDFLTDAGLIEQDLIIDERKIFVLTPFHPDFDKAFQIIREVCNGTNYKCFRGDEQNFKSDIFPHILKFIVSSEIIIANITGRNANVFYELGIAHALNKKVILIAQSEIDHIPIDLQSKRILFYKDEIDLYKKLPLELLKV